MQRARVGTPPAGAVSEARRLHRNGEFFRGRCPTHPLCRGAYGSLGSLVAPEPTGRAARFEDLDRSVAFFTKLGFEFDSRFTDESATCMIVGQGAYFMLLVKERFAGFSPNPLCDSATHTEALFAFTADSREAVGELTDAALAAGGSLAGDDQDHGFMYGRSFRDPDGHQFEVFYMDMEAAEQVATAEGTVAG